MPLMRRPWTGVIADPAYFGSRYLNSIDDAGVGGPVTTMGTGSGYTPGQLGAVVSLDAYWAKKLSNSTYTLYAGVYQYVKFKAASSNSNIVGAPVCWDSYANTAQTLYTVTPDISTDNYLNLAGVTLYANTKGYYGWIFIGPGLVNAYYKASPTANAVGTALVSVASQQYFDAIAIATTLDTYAKQMSIMGYSYEAAGASGSASRHIAHLF